MGQYIHFTVEQKRCANSVNLEAFLKSKGEQFIKSGKEYRWKAHDSVTIRDNQWYRHSTDQGGCAIDFLQEFYNMSFPEAVIALLDSEGIDYQQPDEKPAPERKPFVLPEANSDMRRVFAYLTKTRCIDRDVVQYFAKAKLLYEDAAYHNAVFVGRDENGVAHHAHRRSTLTIGESYRGNVEGSDPKYSFHHAGTSDRLFVFEAPIDLMSYISLHKENWQEYSYVALCGVSPQAMEWVLEQNQTLRSVAFCLDNDNAGIKAVNRISEKLQQTGYAVSRLLPREKDWNAHIMSKKYYPSGV